MNKSTPLYPEVESNPNFAKLEEQVLSLWQKQGTFPTSIENRPAKKESKTNEFIFYDGPPFANGLPHYGHLLTGFVKDLVARYQTMKGRRVERRFGWDCHGLPAEMGSEKELGISGRQAIQQFGIGKFNEHCRTSVMKYTREWEHYVSRTARWVDFKNDYKTMDINFMESVLWAFKQLYEKGLVYEAYRVMPYSWAAETPLSNFETKLDNSYREREDKAITVAFELKNLPKTFKEKLGTLGTFSTFKLLGWTTTPWTLPSNLALAVDPNMDYLAQIYDNEVLIIGNFAREKYLDYFGSPPGLRGDTPVKEEKKSVLKTLIKGSSLLNLEYEPLFPYFQNKHGAFKILNGASFIEEGSGTGIVHLAPGFGEDDQKVCEKNGIELVVPVDGQGKFTDEIYDLPDLKLKGLNVIAEPGGSKFGLANDRIIEHLKKSGKLIRQEQIKHNYPHCWRTDTPLIYRALPSWYVEVTKFRDRAVELNKQINWIPEHVRDGQMGHMLATAPDWSISRNRFWGTPIPVWRSKSGKIKVFGSIAELEKASGKKITDLHRPFIDEIVITEGGEEYTRVEDVFDCWFESGSMPFAQVHYPFENKEWFESHFPADFITEYVGQTRGWFNTLIMLSTALFDKPPFKNCICHGVVLDAETGLKYSKRLKNYKDPLEVIDQFGADALRWLMISSPVMRGQDLSVDPEGKFIRDMVRLAIKPIWNAYNFFTLYANADGVKAEEIYKSDYGMDWYILGECRTAVEIIEQSLDQYDVPKACETSQGFFELLNNVYIRANRDRFWKKSGEVPRLAQALIDRGYTIDTLPEGLREIYTPDYQRGDKIAAYNTLYTVLVTMCKALAPLLPLTTEQIYLGLKGKDCDSVHLQFFPDVSNFERNEEGISEIRRTLDICNAALSIRSAENIRVRQPLRKLTVYSQSWMPEKGMEPGTRSYIENEVNVKEIEFSSDLSGVANFNVKINFPIVGKRLPQKMKQLIAASKQGDWKALPDGRVQVTDEVLEPAEASLTLTPKNPKGAQALSTNDALVILDLEITEELRKEGIARDLVRMIQQARKDANLNITDRITLQVEGDADVITAFDQYKDYIAEQTLASSAAKAAPQGFKAEGEIEGKKITIGLSKAA